MKTMNEQELEIFNLQIELNQLKIEIRQCDKWLEYAKDTAHRIQETIFDLQDKQAKTKVG